MAVAALALSTAIAAGGRQAMATDIYRSGSWTVYTTTANDGVSMCGMRIGEPVKSVHIKWVGGQTGLQIHVFKHGWRIPEGQKVRVEIGFDREQAGAAWARGGMLGGRASVIGTIAFGIKDMAEVLEFLNDFGAANKMWLRFPHGTETAWSADMTGSRDASLMFLKCVGNLKVPTQPHGREPETSQPFGKPEPGDTSPTKRNPVPTTRERGDRAA